MSRVSSLGLHTPAALSYCITEKLLPEHPSPESYIWTTGLPHEELLVTGSAVIWSQGSVIRRVFRYNVEKEPVVRALLTWFPSDDPQDSTQQLTDDDDDNDETGGYISGGSEGNKRKPDWGDDVKAKKRVNTWSSKTRSYAEQLGNFPKARGATGAAGAKTKTTMTEDGGTSKRIGRARALVVFLKTQAFVYFLSGTMHVIHLPFEVQNASAAPRGLVLQRKILVPPPPLMPGMKSKNSFAVRPAATTKDSPRLFTLTDPLYEVGLVMNTANAPATEDLVFISSSSELEDVDKTGISNKEVIFAVTHNADKGQMTVWQVRYILQDTPIHPQRRTPSASGTVSRRRSSFGPGTGATTPTLAAATGSITSAATLSGGKPGRDSLGPNDAVAGLVGLTDDFETTGRRSSRRVSSLVARADLSGNLEAVHRFADVPNSLGASFGGPPPPQNTMIIDEQPFDELLNELNMGALGIGMDDMGAYDSDGLKQEMLMHKLDTFPCKVTGDLDTSERKSPVRVFTLRAPSSAEAATSAGKESPARKVVMFIVNREEGHMLQLTFQVQIHSTMPKGYSRRSSTRYGAAAMGYTPVLTSSTKRTDVLDAIKIQDENIQRVLILTADGKFQIYSPWSGSLDITLPPTLSRWNQHVVGEEGSRRGSRKKGFAKSLSTTPEAYQRLDYSEPGGRLTVVDGDNVGHRISITMSPRDISIKNCLETMRVMLGAESGVGVGEGVLTTWMAVSRWLLVTSDPEAGLSNNSRSASPNEEWKAFVVTLFLFAIPLLPEAKPQSRRKSAFVRSTSLVAQREWEDMASHQGDWGSGPEYNRSAAWRWMADEDDEKVAKPTEAAQTRSRHSVAGTTASERLQNRFITDCVLHARQFMKSPMAEIVQNQFLCNTENSDVRRTGLAVSLVALHLLREEWKLDIALEGPSRRLCPVLRQVATWLGWTGWAEEYMLEDMEMVGWDYDNCEFVFPNILFKFVDLSQLV